MTIARLFFKNILSSWVAYAIRLALGFLFVPYITSVFGSEEYGVWVTVAPSVQSLWEGFEEKWSTAKPSI